MKKIVSVPFLLLLLLMFFSELSFAQSAVLTPAFPGAQGGGMYTTGGRGGDVYAVTNLNDSGPGSFRDAVSQGNRTVVFRVGGVIELQSDLRMAPNLTIAGQTAPGDGITVIGRPVYMSSNTIVRYMRFRLGDLHPTEADAFGGRQIKDVIIDHSSFSWSVDEVLSVYNIENLTVQWSIISEAMHVSRHSKGKHGYGGIWGGKNASFHHNLFAHNSSRNPAFDSTKGNFHDFQNNVIYNWGFFSTYGGKEAYNQLINNVYKPGPDTENIRFLNAETDGSYYLEGNVMIGHPALEADNWSGVHKYPHYKELSEPAPLFSDHPLKTEPAMDAYEAVLAGAGAILPKRDYIDARIVQDVRNGTGRQLNSQTEVGGYPQFAEALSYVVDSDGDGMPDDWEIEHGLDPNDPEDRNGDFNSDGYTNLEKYLHSIVSDGVGIGESTENPSIRITSPKVNSLFEAGSSMLIETEVGGEAEIEKVVFYANDQMIGEATAAPFQWEWNDISDGTYYLTAIVTDQKGLSTGASIIPVHVNTHTDIVPWQSIEIGTPQIAGNTSLSADGQFTVKGSGSIGGTSDDFHYTYVPVKGDFEFSARIDDVVGNDSESKGGIMVRFGLTPDAPMMMASVSYNKGGRNVMSSVRTEAGGEVSSETGWLLHTFPMYVKLARTGDAMTAYMSRDGQDWQSFHAQTISVSAEEVYVGMVADPNNSARREVKNYNATKISELSISPVPDVLMLNPTGIHIPGASVEQDSEVMSKVDAAPADEESRSNHWWWIVLLIVAAGFGIGIGVTWKVRKAHR